MGRRARQAKFKALSLLAILALTAVATQPSLSSASTASDPDPEVTYDSGGHGVDEELIPGTLIEGDPTGTLSLIEDATAWAVEDDIPVATAVATMLDQDVLSAYLATLAETFPGDYAGSWFDGPVLHVRFQDAIPTQATGLVPAALALLTVEFHPNLGFDLADAYSAKDTVNGILADAGLTGYSVVYDHETAQMDVWLAPGSTTPSALQDLITGGTLAVPVVVNAGSEAASVDFQVGRGGGRMRNQDTAAECTSGFSLFRIISIQPPSSETLLSTAAHCRIIEPGDWQYSNPGGAWISADEFASGLGTGNGDVEAYRTPQDEIARFYYTGSLHRPVSGALNISQGQQVCFYGRTSGARCSTVKSTNGSYYTTSGLSFDHMVFMANRAAVTGGDSGGPWFKGQKAAGIHSARVTLPNGTVRLAFTPIDQINATTGKNFLLAVAD